jgi:hypothetical protein
MDEAAKPQLSEEWVVTNRYESEPCMQSVCGKERPHRSGHPDSCSTKEHLLGMTPH